MKLALLPVCGLMLALGAARADSGDAPGLESTAPSYHRAWNPPPPPGQTEERTPPPARDEDDASSPPPPAYVPPPADDYVPPPWAFGPAYWPCYGPGWYGPGFFGPAIGIGFRIR